MRGSRRTSRPGLSRATTTPSTSRATSQTKGRLFFNTLDGLVPKDANSQEDVYEYEPAGSEASARNTPSANRPRRRAARSTAPSTNTTSKVRKAPKARVVSR